jgi:hypothetical protein
VDIGGAVPEFSAAVTVYQLAAVERKSFAGQSFYSVSRSNPF